MVDAPHYTAKKFAWNTFLYLANNILMKPVTLAVQVLMVRKLGNEKLGTYALIWWTYLFIFRTTTEMGINRVTLRDLSRSPKDGPETLGLSVGSMIVAGLANFAVCNLLFLSIGISSEFKMAIFLGSLQLPLMFGGLYLQVYQSKLEMMRPLVIGFLGEIGFSACACVILFTSGSIVHLVAARAFFTAVPVLAIIPSSAKIIKPRIHFEWKKFVPLAGEAIPMGLVTLSTLMHERIDMAVLDWNLGKAFVGQYYAAVQLALSLLFIPVIFTASLLPVLSSFFINKPESFVRVINQCLKIMLAVILPIAVGTSLLGQPIIEWLYGASKYPQTAGALAILIWKVVFLFANAVFFTAFIAMGKQVVILYTTLGSFALNLIGNILLVPRFGIPAAAWTTVISNGLITAASLWVLNAERPGVKFEGLAKMAVASLAAGWLAYRAHAFLAPYWADADKTANSNPLWDIARGTPVMGAVLAAALCYFLILTVLRILNTDDKALLQKAFKSGKKINLQAETDAPTQ